MYLPYFLTAPKRVVERALGARVQVKCICDFLPNGLKGRRSISQSAPKERPKHTSPQFISSFLWYVKLLYSEVFSPELRDSSLLSQLSNINCGRGFYDVSGYAFLQKEELCACMYHWNA